MTSFDGSQWEQMLVQYQQAGAATEPHGLFTPGQGLSLVTVLLVTRNPSHISHLQNLVAAHGSVMQCVVCSDVTQAWQVCAADVPRLLIIDAALLDTIPVINEPFIVCGHCNQDAMRAFAARADGFIAMPVNPRRFDETLSYVAGRILRQQQRHTYTRLRQLLLTHYDINALQFPQWLARHSRDHTAPRVTLRSSNAWITLGCADILWVQAAGDYMCVYTQAENHIVRTTLGDLSRKLCPDLFERVNRSVLVNRDFVKTVKRQGPQSAFVILLDDTRLKISRRYFTAHWQHII